MNLIQLFYLSWAVLQLQHPEEPGGAEWCSFGPEAAGGRGTASGSPPRPSAAVSIVRPRHAPRITQSAPPQNHRHLGYANDFVENRWLDSFLLDNLISLYIVWVKKNKNKKHTGKNFWIQSKISLTRLSRVAFFHLVHGLV